MMGAVVPAAQPLAQVHAVKLQQDVHEDHIKFFPAWLSASPPRPAHTTSKFCWLCRKYRVVSRDPRVIFHH